MLQPPRRRHAVSAVVLAILCWASLAAVPPAHAALIAVSTTADELNRNGNCSLREAIRAANQNKRVDSCPAGGSAPDTIALPAGTYPITIGGGDDAAALGDLDLTGTTTINGAGRTTTIVDGNALHRVFDIRPNATVTLTKLTVRNGFPGPGADGGGIINSGTLTLMESQVTGSRAEATERRNNGNGGGIWSSGMLTLTQSLVTDNQATSHGEYPETSGDGGGIFSTGRLTLRRSTISGNRSEALLDDGNGGGIYTSGSATIVESTIADNYAYSIDGGNGGGIYFGGGTLDINRSTISNNAAESDSRSSTGGGIATRSGTSGSSEAITLSNTTISGNQAMSGAGISHGSQGSLTLQSSTVTANIGQSDDDGNASRSAGILGTVTVLNTILAGNFNRLGVPAECFGTLNSQGYNLIGATSDCTMSGTTTGNQLDADPRLSPLQPNGGPTLTHLLRYGSPAIDSGSPAAPGSSGTACPVQDQRGVARPQDGNRDGSARCDIGALESRVDSATGQEVLPDTSEEETDK